MNDLPSFDEVHVISDLHMGGKPGFQILRETTRLANYIRWVATQRPDGQVALVLNGDIVDTLAEDGTGYVAVDEAVQMLTRIMADPAFAGVFDALAVFVATARRTLVLVIGNHDIELAFPPVQRRLRARLCGDSLEARARLEYSTAGAGYTCLVGGNLVHCIHGNEVDAWNYNRYEDLARVSRRLNAGQTLAASDWKPNAGTRMVKDVMNNVKRRYAWIDLLKPEAEAAARTLLAIDPTQAKAVTELFGIIGEKVVGSFEVDGRLSADGFVPPLPGAAKALTMQDVLGPLGQPQAHSADDLLDQAERDFKAPPRATGAGDGQLGTGGYLWDQLTGWLRGLPEGEALRRALVDWLKDDVTYVVDNRDDTYKAVTAAIGPSIDFVVTGHTHLERAIDMGNRYYFNTGTWIRLMQFTPEMLASTGSFLPVYAALKDGSMAAIDKGVNGHPLVRDQTSSVCIRRAGDQVIGTLHHVEGDGTGAPVAVRSFQRGVR
jgi:UDP-2,3-diacylglucosamine pyrophosphatase LpxH